MEKIKQYYTIALSCIISFCIGYFVLKPKQETKEVIKYVTIEVEKKKTKKVTRVSERRNTDGSSSTDTVITEDSQSESSSSSSSSREIITSSSKSLTLTLLGIKNSANLAEKTNIGLVVSVPVIGRLSASTYVDSNKNVGLGLSLEF